MQRSSLAHEVTPCVAARGARRLAGAALSTPNYALAALLVPPTSLAVLILVGVVLQRRRRALGLGLIALSALALLVLSMPVVAWALARGLEEPPLQERNLARAQAIVILAGGAFRNAPEWGGETVNTITLARVHYGAALARRTRLPILITGGINGPGDATEAELMRRALEQVYDLRVRWVETGSRTTAENARMSASVLGKDGIQRVLLVTDGVHMRRARRVFEGAGLEIVPAPTAYWGQSEGPRIVGDYIPNAESLRRSSHVLREWLANALYRVRE